MSEPISGAAAGAAGWKVIGGLAGMGAIGAGLATFVVMAMTKPRTDQEWRVALASTFAGSVGGGAVLVKYLGIERWADDLFGMIALGGLIFACGLPAWALVRAAFKWLEKRRDADLAELVKDAKEVI